MPKIASHNLFRILTLIVLGPILRFYTLSAPPVQHRFDVFFYILGLWANDFKTLTKNKSVRKSYYRTVFDMNISANKVVPVSPSKWPMYITFAI